MQIRFRSLGILLGMTLIGQLTCPSFVDGAGPPVGEKLVPVSWIFNSWADYRQNLTIDSPRNYIGPKIISADIEIRKIDKNLRIARLPCDLRGGPSYYGTALGQSLVWQQSFTEDQIKLLRETEPGEYQIAIYINNERASNVASVQIDPAFEPTNATALKVGVIEPHPLGPASNEFVIWLIVPSTPPPKDLFLQLPRPWVTFVDGKEGRLASLSTPNSSSSVHHFLDTRMAAEAVSGARFVFPFDRAKTLSPPITKSETHTYQVKLGSYVSDSILVSGVEDSLNAQWDNATPIMIDRASPSNIENLNVSSIPSTGKVSDPPDKTNVLPGIINTPPPIFIGLTIPAGSANLPDVITNMHVTNLPLVSVVKLLSSVIHDPDYKFMLDSDVDRVHADYRVTFDFRNCNLEAMLQVICQKQGLTYEVQGKNVLIHQPKEGGSLIDKVLSTTK